jgi:hypothetical protein
MKQADDMSWGRSSAGRAEDIESGIGSRQRIDLALKSDTVLKRRLIGFEGAEGRNCLCDYFSLQRDGRMEFGNALGSEHWPPIIKKDKESLY